jgi:predicted SAM-dependent methyltransferase
MPGYEGYVSVDASAPASEWAIQHDLTTPIPLPDASVERIHTEDFLEHIPEGDIRGVLRESYRLLVPWGVMRIGVPDYNNPKDRPYLERGHDPRYPGHVTLTTYPLFKRIVEESPFERYRFYHYWDGDRFVRETVDYRLGMIRRSPDNHPSCRRRGVAQHTKGIVRDFAFRLSKGFAVTEVEMATRKGRPLNITSLIVDLFKEG